VAIRAALPLDAAPPRQSFSALITSRFRGPIATTYQISAKLGKAQQSFAQ